MSNPDGQSVAFYFDPSCPWTWITSRWLTEVAASRELEVTWRTFSLSRSNEWAGNAIPEMFRGRIAAQFRGLRVLEAARAAYGEVAVAALYTEFGARIHHDDDGDLTGLADAIAAVGLAGTLLDAADDESWDSVIDDSTRAGQALVGHDVGVPIIVIGGGTDRVTFSGPIMSPAPGGDAALRLWDLYAGLGEFDGLFEIKRSRNVGPVFGPRPT